MVYSLFAHLSTQLQTALSHLLKSRVKILRLVESIDSPEEPRRLHQQLPKWEVPLTLRSLAEIGPAIRWASADGRGVNRLPMGQGLEMSAISCYFTLLLGFLLCGMGQVELTGHTVDGGGLPLAAISLPQEVSDLILTDSGFESAASIGSELGYQLLVLLGSLCGEW